MTAAGGQRPKLRLRRAAAGKPDRKRQWLGWAGGVFARLWGGRTWRVTNADLRKQDYPTSTQRLGVRFTERIRDTFRFRWLRKTSDEDKRRE
jgi:hypothetical protein